MCALVLILAIDHRVYPNSQHQARQDNLSMKTKHTPGPWVVSDLVRQSVEIGASVVRLPIGKHDAADARLIAAAPDLLEALEAMVEDVDNNAPGTFSGVQKARTAIAKAKGET